MMSSDIMQKSMAIQNSLFKYEVYKGFIVRMFTPPTFQKLTIIIGIVALIIALALIATAFYSMNKSRNHPPDIAECPDFFISVGKDKCVNKQGLGKASGGADCTDKDKVHDFSGSLYRGRRGKGKKLNKAHQCGWEWDGITNDAELLGVDGDVIPG